MPSANFSHWIAQRGAAPRYELHIEGCPIIFASGGEPVDVDRITQNVGSVAFLSTTGELRGPSISNPFSGGDFFFAAWLNPQGFTGTRGIFEFHDGTNGWAIYTDSGAIKVVVKSTVETTTITLTADRYQYLAVTVGGTDGCELRALHILPGIDGGVDVETSYTGSFYGAGALTRTLRAGWAITESISLGDIDSYSAMPSWGGFFSRAYLGGRCMTASEMRSLAYCWLHSGWPIYSTGMISWWSFEEAAGTIVRDHIGANDLTMQNANTIWDGDPVYEVEYLATARVPGDWSQSIDPQQGRAEVSGFSTECYEPEDGEPISAWLASVGMALRKRKATLFLGFEGMYHDEYEPVFVGNIETVQPLMGRGWQITIGDSKSQAKVPLELASTTAAEAIDASETTIDVASIKGFAALTESEQDASRSFSSYVRIDDEIMQITGYTTGGTQQFTVTRGALGTTAATHATGTRMDELLLIRDVNPMVALTMLLGSPTGGGAVTWDQYTSSIDSLCRFTTDNSKTATEGRGAGLGPTELDVDYILNTTAADFYGYGGGTWDGSFLIEQSIDDIKRWCEDHILRPLGAFFFTTATGKLSVGSWADRAAGATLIEQGDQSRPQPSIEYGEVISSLTIDYDRDPIADVYDSTVAYEDVTIGAAHGRQEMDAIASPWIRTDDFGGTAFTPDTVLDGLWAIVTSRFGAPLYYVDVQLPLEWYDVEVDEVVKLEHPHLPDLAAGARGWQGVECQVVGRTFSPRRASIILRLLRMP